VVVVVDLERVKCSRSRDFGCEAASEDPVGGGEKSVECQRLGHGVATGAAECQSPVLCYDQFCVCRLFDCVCSALNWVAAPALSSRLDFLHSKNP